MNLPFLKKNKTPLALSISVLFYWLSFPNPVFYTGIGFFALIAIVPVLLLKKKKPAWALLQGIVFGFVLYAGLFYWLLNYHVFAWLIAVFYSSLFMSLAFLLLALAEKLPPYLAIPVSVMAWTACEVLRSSGLLAFPYGTLPYALYESRLALSVLKHGGIVSLSIAIAGVNTIVAHLVRSRHAIISFFNDQKRQGGKAFSVLALPVVTGIVFTAFFVAGNPRYDETYSAWQYSGAVSTADALPADTQTMTANSRAQEGGAFRVALIQPGGELNQANPDDYARVFDVLKQLSLEAAQAEPDLVVWHECAIIPAIDWHYRYRPDRAIYEFISQVKDFLDDYPIPILLGNAWADLADPHRFQIFNSALLYRNGVAEDRYGKIRLVPFREFDPLGGWFPALARWLQLNFGHFWTEGKDYSVFELNGAKFASPICFEDSFPPLFRGFGEVDFFVVLTDDSWGMSRVLQRQHLAMSVFRAAETGRPVLRASADGATALISPAGAIIAVLEPHKSGILLCDLELQ